MQPIWAQNLAKWITGTTVGSKQCIDVNVANTVAVPVTPASYAYKERRFHLPASKTINKRTGVWVQLDANSDVAANTPADIANTITEIRINWNGGSALEIGSGANSGAVSVIASAGAGQTSAIGVSLASGDKVWVRAIQDVDIVTGELLCMFLG
jgi:hypothetical protein